MILFIHSCSTFFSFVENWKLFMRRFEVVQTFFSFVHVYSIIFMTLLFFLHNPRSHRRKTNGIQEVFPFLQAIRHLFCFCTQHIACVEYSIVVTRHCPIKFGVLLIILALRDIAWYSCVQFCTVRN